MKVQLPIMIQDPLLSGYTHMNRIVERPIFTEDGWAEGPACARVKVEDKDPATGLLCPPVRFTPSQDYRKQGHFELEGSQDNIYAPGFIALSAFGTVLHTMNMFEEEDTLGRPVKWAFNAPLLVRPRAGKAANAQYDRTSHSLNFFYFDQPPSPRVYTALSRDIVCHETGHAILDGISPLLLWAKTPEGFALHETIADLTAVVMSFRSQPLRQAILNETGGSIDNVRTFSSIAEQFGEVKYQQQKLDCLRDLRTPMCMDEGRSKGAYPMSQVLSAALYGMIVGMHRRWWQLYCGGEGAELEIKYSGKALYTAVEHFKRMIFRALDYLPPGEVSFADYGRAIIAADQASHPNDKEEREFIRQEFTRRGIVKGPEELDVETNFEHPAVQAVDLGVLLSDEGAARDFAARNRELLRIPQDVNFSVQDRLDVTKLYYHKAGSPGGRTQLVRECLFKVCWNQPVGGVGLVTVGTTLAIDRETKRVRAVLTTEFA